jgi:acyl-CoA synthetase (AMP-forming)/AMP-acid ligase II/acyl carrier protein
MFSATTLTDLIESNRNAPRSITYVEGEQNERSVAFGELYERALGMLHALQKLGARPGDKLILFLAGNEQLIDAFWAAILGGIIPVPVAPGITDDHRRKFLRIAHKLGKPFIYADRRSLERVETFTAQTKEQAALQEMLRNRALLVDRLDNLSSTGNVYRAQPDDVALIQFSSGSTSEPKGVVLTHRNIIANALGVTERAGFSEEDVSLSWMPLTHDMGLIGSHIYMFANRLQVNLMSSELFIRRPLLWLTLAMRKRATMLCSPNFGYRHFLKALDGRPVEGLDLSSVRLIFNGAEPISVDLCNEFFDRLALARLARSAMFPVYGLAEASLAVSFPPVGRPYRSVTFNRHRLGAGKRVETVAASDKNAVVYMAVGSAIPYCRVRVADDDDRALPDGQVGHIHISGESVTQGYYENPEADAVAFTADGWLRTGDLGVVHEGELYITGRAKEIIFVNGQNYYPQDLESVAQQVEGLELGKVVAAGVRSRDAQTDQLVVFVLHRTNLRDFVPIAAQVARLINERSGLEVWEVVPVKRIPKTTSGKIQRHLLEQRYIEGEFSAQLTELRALREAVRGPVSTLRTQIEEKIRSIVNAALEGKKIDIHDDLFEVGVNSLKLVEIHEQIEREYPGRIDIMELFDFSTIAELTRRLETKLAGA